MVQIVFKNKDGSLQEVSANIGESILDAAKRNGIKLFGGCDGAGVCGTCHVIITDLGKLCVDEPTANEIDLLEVLPNSSVNSRLACQVVVSESLEGAIINIP